jgi:hypothetical protein
MHVRAEAQALSSSTQTRIHPCFPVRIAHVAALATISRRQMDLCLFHVVDVRATNQTS